MIEELSDTRAMFDSGEFAELIYLGAGIEILGIFDQNFDDALDVNGRRTGIRCVNTDVTAVAIGSTLTIKSSDVTYTVRAKEQGARTTLLILEQT